MSKIVRNRYLLLSDVILLPIAAYMSFVLRLEDYGVHGRGAALLVFGALVSVIVPMAFYCAGIYKRYWPYASVDEVLLLVWTLVAAIILTTGLSAIVQYFMPHAARIPRSIPFIFFLLAPFATMGPRVWMRRTALTGKRQAVGPVQRVLIIGAGDAGKMILRELQQNAQLGMEVVGLIDDDGRKQGMRIHNVPVLGTREAIPILVDQYAIDYVIIAMPSASGKIIREITQVCNRIGIQVKSIPGMYELLDGTVPVNRLRDVGIEDLLRRAPIETDTAGVKAFIEGQRVLVTGGGGSIGSELCRQILRCDPAELIVLGHGENSVFEIQYELMRQLASRERIADHCHQHAGPMPRITGVIADIRSPERMHAVFEQHRPSIVFHAAAHKHVPLMELNPSEAITNNVLGTRNVIDAALAVDVEHFIMVSTDKAVNPTNIMGATKRVGELLVHQAAQRSGKPYLAVRFGNVLGSRGSVVLTFRQQIAAGGPVTVTDPEMRRFFMTIPEAVQLLLQAAVLGKGGEVFMLEMGQPIKVVDLARDMIRLSGLVVDDDINIVYSGLRPGEKLFEELFIKGEEYQPTQHHKLFIAQGASRVITQHLNEAVKQLSRVADQNDSLAIRAGLQRLVPEFQPERAKETRVYSDVVPHQRETGGDMRPGLGASL